MSIEIKNLVDFRIFKVVVYISRNFYKPPSSLKNKTKTELRMSN